MGRRNTKPYIQSGLRSSPSNYRGITVLPIFGKIFEIAIQNRLQIVEDAFNSNDPHNAGFQKGSRTADNIFFLNGLIEKQLAMGNNLIVIFVDFSQAFDRINRNILFYKLKQNGLRGRLIDVLENLYNKTSFRVKYGGRISCRIKESCGVNQGGNASPFLFRKYLQDLIDYLDVYTGVHISSHTLLNRAWADDVFLVSTINKHAQLQINGLLNFCSPNQMVVNDIKTKVMVYGKDIEINIELNGKRLEEVRQYKCLGTILNSLKEHLN